MKAKGVPVPWRESSFIKSSYSYYPTFIYLNRVNVKKGKGIKSNPNILILTVPTDPFTSLLFYLMCLSDKIKVCWQFIKYHLIGIQEMIWSNEVSVGVLGLITLISYQNCTKRGEIGKTWKVNLNLYNEV